MEPSSVLIVVENNTVPMDRRVWYVAISLRDAGWQVTIICPDASGAQAGNQTRANQITSEILEGITIYRFPLRFADKGASGYLQEYTRAFFSILRLSWKVWRMRRFDIIHICNPPDIFFPIGYLFKLLGARFIFDHHDLFPELVENRFHGVFGKLFLRAALVFESLTYKCANMVITTNESYRQIGCRRNKIREDKVIVVRNGPKLSEFTPVEPLIELKRGFPYMVCFVGIMGEDDGLFELVQVIRVIVCDMKRQDIIFALIGDGSVRPIILEMIKEYKLTDYVSMPGLIRDDLLLRQYMSTADAFVSPEPLTAMNVNSTFIKIGEYMAMGKPIVAFDLKETHYTAGEAALYAPPGDIQAFSRGLIEVLDDVKLRQSMGTFGMERVRDHLAWEHQQIRLIEAYRIQHTQKR